MADFTRLDSEVIQIARTDIQNMWQDYQFGRPGRYCTYEQHFNSHVAADWTITLVNSSTPALATAAPTVGGVLLMQNTAAANDKISMQKVGHSVVPTVGSTIWYETRMQMDSAALADTSDGLVITDTDLTSITDGLMFVKNNTAVLSFTTVASAGATSTDGNVFTTADATYVKLGIKIVGTSLVEYWVNDVKKGSFTTNIPAVPLRISSSVLNHTAAARSKSVDYIICSQSVPGF